MLKVVVACFIKLLVEIKPIRQDKLLMNWEVILERAGFVFTAQRTVVFRKKKFSLLLIGERKLPGNQHNFKGSVFVLQFWQFRIFFFSLSSALQTQ